jgi:Fe2+ or Zn2+ uptake regulation protein
MEFEMKKLQDCIEKKGIHTSRSRECIYKLLKENSNCMSAEEILEKAKELYSVKLSLNTLYRHLKLFLECDLIVALQSDTKKAYYSLKSSQVICFSICSESQSVSKVDIKVENLPLEIQNADYLCIYKKCSECV